MDATDLGAREAKGGFLGSIHLHGELFRYIAKYFANERNILLLSKMLFSKDDKNFAI